jgi:hypothetical protein
MDFSKLDQNEKLATYGSIAVVLAGLVSNWGGLLFLSILAAIGMLAVVFLPQLSPSTNLPGSKGTLMAALGIAAALGAIITALQWISVLGAILGSLGTIMFLIAIIGAIVMAWAGWQELQSEGGKWVFGGSSATASGAAAAPPPAPAPAAQEPMNTSTEPAPARDSDASIGAADTVAGDPMRRDDEDRSAG